MLAYHLLMIWTARKNMKWLILLESIGNFYVFFFCVTKIFPFYLNLYGIPTYIKVLSYRSLVWIYIRSSIFWICIRYSAMALGKNFHLQYWELCIWSRNTMSKKAVNCKQDSHCRSEKRNLSWEEDRRFRYKATLAK